ncbi:hypothetical protein DIU31_024280 [Mucilaginibacter rubeus]|uniref:Uncharacterized protein n=1 Tax=Mucilaginibacter rubeus TaxID=2027860 RepID=A0AAE6JJA1_9SPHI|nr:MULTISPECIES: hypothetical protein [Mucilaginibacter]QEM06481.1 hypothetical protein DIU31_024280 [Mucilaginibacter rubeus]QEM19067.1 hypothetical protein DIU38_024530 [Mucilaginibacter gossypii]QTE44392.1 hypothetical protein J3L19_03190 [Mucilaginibacter rubeus]QTE50991.1 hypothetical protein J3L21_03165 [Mucilaginibacter rubeus]QTE56075.1 hypothetical protein J3L23_28405 [Mucilaginibacter rubeus]
MNDNKSRLLSVGTSLKFDSATTYDRLPDIKMQLGSLVIGKMENNKLSIIDMPLKDVDIPYDKPSILQESTITEKSVIAKLKVSIPIYGSIESSMSNSDLHQVKWDISYYPFQSNVSFSKLIGELNKVNKAALVSNLKLNNSNLDIYLIRNFDIIESGVFSVTSGTKINTEGSAAFASVFTASAAYAFKSEDSKFISIPNKAYNIKYEKWQTVGELIKKLEDQLAIPLDGTTQPVRLTPLMANQ